MDLSQKEERLQERLRKIEELEREIKESERAIKAQEGAKKQVLLRLAPSLWQDIAVWAQDDYRSINGQIEYILSESVKRRKKGSKIES